MSEYQTNGKIISLLSFVECVSLESSYTKSGTILYLADKYFLSPLTTLDARLWIKKMASAMRGNFPAKIASTRIMPFLLENPNRPEPDVELEKREMLRNMIRSELWRTNGRDPGQNKIGMDRLEVRWADSSAEEDKIVLSLFERLFRPHQATLQRASIAGEYIPAMINEMLSKAPLTEVSVQLRAIDFIWEMISENEDDSETEDDIDDFDYIYEGSPSTSDDSEHDDDSSMDSSDEMFMG